MLYVGLRNFRIFGIDNFCGQRTAIDFLGPVSFRNLSIDLEIELRQRESVPKATIKIGSIRNLVKVKFNGGFNIKMSLCTSF